MLATALFIADDLEAVGGEGGATYEVVVSRMRFMATAGGGSARLVGLSLPLANARDVGDWLGAPAAGTFNFHPQVRPVPLEIRLAGFDVPHAGARLLAMARPVYAAAAAAATGAGRQALVFTPNRKQAQLTAIDLVAFAAADGAPARFRAGRASAGDVEAALGGYGVRDGALATCLRAGVAYYHEGMRPADRAAVTALWAAGALGVVVAPADAARGMPAAAWGAHLVVLMGTEAFEGRARRVVDYPVADVLHLMGRACVPAGDAAARVVIMCAAPRKEYLRKFLYEALPVESGLPGGLADHLNAEVVAGGLASKQDCLDYLTWTLLYRRLPQNPNYYNLAGVSPAHISDYLSELVDASLGALEACQCVSLRDDMYVDAANLGRIAAYYYVAYASLEVFASSLSPKTKLKGVLEVLAHAAEYDALPMRHGEDAALRALAAHAPLSLPAPPPGRAGSLYHDPHVKANLLLQAYFSGCGVPPELRADTGVVVEAAVPLLQAMVDVIATEGWLKPALAVMELCQMVVQGQWADRDSLLLQVPHVNRDRAAALEAASPPIESVYDLLVMDDDARAAALGLPSAALADVARFCARYPNVSLTFDLPGGASAAPDDAVPLIVHLTRDGVGGLGGGAAGGDGGGGASGGAGGGGVVVGSVHAPKFPRAKAEGWWLVVGEAADNSLLAVKRVTLGASATIALDFVAPATPGDHTLTLSLMCDSYLGCDQEFHFTITVTPPPA